MRQRFSVLASLTVLVGFGAYARQSTAQEPKKAEPAPKKEVAKDYEEAVLTHFKRPTDTASLIAYLKEHSASDDDLLAIPDLIKQLGDDEYERRHAASKKLVTLGLPAFMPLLAAMNDSDAERAELAKSTIGKMDRNTHTIAVPPVTIRMLMKRKPPELLEVLLRYLPYTTDPEVEEDLYYGIEELAVKDGKINPLLIKALDDKLPARRAVAGCIVARVGTDEQKRSAYTSLQDSDANVRLRTAQGYLAGLDKTGVMTLIDLLTAKPMCLAWQAEELLIWVAGNAAPKELVWSGGERAKKAKAAWQKWFKENEATVDLQKVAKGPRKPLLLTPAAGIIGSNGAIRWSAEFNPALNISRTFLLPNNRMGGVNVAQEGFTVNCCFYDMTFDGKDIRKTTWRHESPLLIHGASLAVNGMMHLFGDHDIVSIGLEGKVLANINTSRAAHNEGATHRATPLGYTDGLVWVQCIDTKLEMLMMDPQNGAIVNRWSLSGQTELLQIIRTFPASRGRMMLTAGTSLWSFDFGKLQSIPEFVLDKDQRIHRILPRPLRSGGFVVAQDSDMSLYYPNWKVRSKASVSPFSFGSFKYSIEVVPLVDFGFP